MGSSKTFYVEIVTPEKAVFKGEVVDFTAPGVQGQFEILHNHAMFLSSIDIGQLRLTPASGEENYYATSGGFVEVQNNHVIVLAETAEHVDEIDIERAKTALERANQRLGKKSPEIDVIRVEIAMQKALNRLKVAKI